MSGFKEDIDRPTLTELERQLGADWPAIRKAASDATTRRRQILELLRQDKSTSHSEDASVVVFGSLARGEWTSGSDVDWTFLVDGEANPEHYRVAQSVGDRLAEASFAGPGPSGIFGNLAFSHELIHVIGGDQDTNRNLTQRVLLLLESIPIGDASAYDRVVRGALDRYLEDDPSFLSPDPDTRKLPRFLLNDVVRFWRTMAVDYATKRRERGPTGWALRNLKLRMSRKLIFVKGLLTCYRCVLKSPSSGPPSPRGVGRSLPPLISRLTEDVGLTPLEMVAQAWLDCPNPERARRMFDTYNDFLSTLDDREKRERLKALQAEEAGSDPLFQELRAVAHEFQASLDDLFFETADYFRLTKKYGVF